MIDGSKLIEWGFKPGKWFGPALATAQKMETAGVDLNVIFNWLEKEQPVEIGIRTNALPYNTFFKIESETERKNLALVTDSMDKLMRTPTIVAGAIMPDACPAGTISVGAVVATKNAIHPGFHSADVCCSMAMTMFHRDMNPKDVLDLAHKVTHFGYGGRKEFHMSHHLMKRFEGNPFLKDLVSAGDHAMGTQGDGNHFLFVGRVRSTGKIAVVTHHGSRKPGAELYKRGMALAKKRTKALCPRLDPGCAWIEADTQEGQDYWAALQIMREWTKENHFKLHDRMQSILGNRIEDRFWNEHNFVFQRADGLFYHAKGATPSFAGFSPDDDGRTLIPMNMSEPILIARHTDRKKALGFAPHGAGRNLSRTKYLRDVIAGKPADEVIREQAPNIDARFYNGSPDLSELPGAYKRAEQVIGQIEEHRLANIDDYIDPYGSIMAGEQPQPWKDSKK